jgi:hypothetical protein
MAVQSASSSQVHDVRNALLERNSADIHQQEMTSMTQNFRPVSFALLSGALMLVGSSMAFANPDQTNPRESALAAPCVATSATNCETVSQDSSMTADSRVSRATVNHFSSEADHDARRDRTQGGQER